MVKKKTSTPTIKAEATAKAEVVAKATYQRKHSITEVVPPDVTRAKAGAWLDVISPITEWAGLKGDALRYRRQQLRIQQEAALDRLAKNVKEMMGSRRVTTPLPPKILVPALESASLEDPESPLISWWANLLVSGATGTVIRPYLVNLMTAIGSEEAECLSKIWQGISANKEYLTEEYDLKLSATFRATSSIREELASLERAIVKPDDFPNACFAMFGELGDVSEALGFPVEFTIFEKRLLDNEGHNFSLSVPSDLLANRIPIDVCLALKLLEDHYTVFDPEFRAHKIRVPDEFQKSIGIRVIAPSKLGVEFLKACNPQRTSKARSA